MPDALYFPGLVPSASSSVEEFMRRNEFVQRRLRVADEVLGYSLLDAYAKAEIYDWEVFETGFMVLTLALADWTMENLDIDPVLCGGQSFGAIVAAVFTGALDYPDAIEFIRASTAVETDYFNGLPAPMGCLFFYRLDSASVDRLIEQCRSDGLDLEASVYLDDSVHAVSGPIEHLKIFRQLIRDRGGHAFYLMNRAEHCPSVAPLRERLKNEVYQKFTWNTPSLPLLSDVTGELLHHPDAIMEDLLDGWVSPVHWTTVVEGIRTAGADNVLIIGPRNMFARITNNRLPTAVVTPKVIDEFPVKGFPPPTLRSSKAMCRKGAP